MLTIVIPSYNNLDYLELCYQSIRESSTDVKLIIFDDGSSDGTDKWLKELSDENLKYEIFEERIGHTILYDRGFQMADTKYIGILHADMVVSKNTIPNILKSLDTNKIVSVTCIEPPIHPEGSEKVQMDFGMYPKDFDSKQFNSFCKSYGNSVLGETSDSLFAPWFINKEEYVNRIGKHDELFAPYGWEDSDIFVRMALAGFDIVRMKDTFVYHFTQRGHKWKNGNVGDFNSDYKLQMFSMQREFIRKWGTDICRDNEHRPVKITKYDIGLKINNVPPQVLGYLEPHFSSIYCDADASSDYIQHEMKITKSNLLDKFYPYENTPQNNIVVECDAKDLIEKQERFRFITMLPFVIKESGTIGKFKYDCFDITINKMEEYQKTLVKL